MHDLINQRTQELGLQHAVRLFGLRSDVAEIMQSSDLLLFPSLREGLSLTLMEASAARLPIVASDIPGNAEATANGTSARLHAVGDYNAMADSVCQLLEQPEIALKFTRRAREVYEEKFSLDESIKRWQQLYAQVMTLPNKALNSRVDLTQSVKAA